MSYICLVSVTIMFVHVYRSPPYHLHSFNSTTCIDLAWLPQFHNSEHSKSSSCKVHPACSDQIIDKSPVVTTQRQRIGKDSNNAGSDHRSGHGISCRRIWTRKLQPLKPHFDCVDKFGQCLSASWLPVLVISHPAKRIESHQSPCGQHAHISRATSITHPPSPLLAFQKKSASGSSEVVIIVGLGANHYGKHWFLHVSSDVSLSAPLTPPLCICKFLV